ncbi:MAG: DNA polymerase III subunit epsilon [Anaerolineae bacterium]|nr:DNA polymerase III subunit epsilon [Anaerolineae bacterium]
MKSNSYTLLIVVAVGGLLLGSLLVLLLTFWLNSSQLVMALVVILFLLLALAFVVSPMLQGYLKSPSRLAEEIQIIVNANPAHRLSVKDTPGSMQPIAEAINALAEQYQETLTTQDLQIQQGEAKLQDEKNKLTALIAELNEGVIVCNIQGRILLYNSRASALLSRDAANVAGATQPGFVGLGRSIFGVMDRNVLINAAKTVERQLEDNSGYEPAHLVIVAANGNLLRVRLIPIVTERGEINGFILSLEDVNQLSATSLHQYDQIDLHIKTVQTALEKIQATAVRVKETPVSESSRLLDDIISQTAGLNGEFEQISKEFAAGLNLFDWRMEEILGGDLLWAIQQAAADELNITAVAQTPEEPIWLRTDSALMVQLMINLMRRLKEEFGLTQTKLDLDSNDEFAALEMAWSGRQAPLEEVKSWQDVAFSTPLTTAPVSMTEVIEVHGGRIQWAVDEAADQVCLKLLLPSIPPKTTPVRQIVHGSRPEFYDFDLFHQAGYTPDLEQRPLVELSFTVFDTETTGLRPAEGDEITSISAIRIVNGRLLHHETFDQLVDPQRSLPRQSIEITGITPDMVAGQPTIDHVLPEFYAFVEDTVLVAHNAAFDMRCLQVKEAQTGVKFSQPVMDTLLLSAVLHPHYDDHSLEAIAERLGITIMGRHSSLGDSMVTGEILLKLIPLLADKGIVTLAQAQKEAQKSYLARLNY